MNFKELIEQINQFKDTEEYKEFVRSLVNTDSVSAFLDTEDGKKLMQPRLDRYHNKGLESWKANNLQGLIDAKVKELYPDADPKDVEINKLKQMLEEQRASAKRQELTNKALTIANEKGLPVDLIGYFVGSDEDSTLANLDTLEKAFTSAVSSTIETKLKNSSHVPPVDESKPIDGVTQAFMALNPGLTIADE